MQPDIHIRKFYKSLLLLILVVGSLNACQTLKALTHDAAYQEMAHRFKNTRRLAVFIQRWPFYLELPGQSTLDQDFIKTSTPFAGAFQPADPTHPRAVDVADVDDCFIEDVLLRELAKKGFLPEVGAITLLPARGVTVSEIMARYQLINPHVQAFLFCFYSPTVFVARPDKAPQQRRRPCHLQDLIAYLNPGHHAVIWAGPHAADAPPGAITHAFIYWSMTMFRAWTWEPLIMVAGSRVAAKPRFDLPQCPPAPTTHNYPADTQVILRLMADNLRCRLRFLLPDAFD